MMLKRGRSTSTILIAFFTCIGLLARNGLADAQAQDPGPLAAVETGHCAVDERFTLVLHGGSVFYRGSFHGPKLPVLEQALADARSRLAAGARAIDVAEAAVATLEDSGLFNAGRGAIANRAGNIELDASIMDGRDLKAGAVAAIRDQRNPVRAARLVMDRSEHVMLVGPNGDRFLQQQGGETVDTAYFLHGGQNFSGVPLPDDLEIVPSDRDEAAYLGIWAGVFLGDFNAILVVEKVESGRASVIYAYGPHPTWGKGFYRRLEAQFIDGALHLQEPADLGGYRMVYRLGSDDKLAMTASHPDLPGAEGSMTRLPAKPGEYKGGTVGAVVRDRCGDLAAATSTGGFDSKIPGRVGDSPIIGAGTYADNRTAAVSATGHGEFFMRHVVAYDITAAMKYQGSSLQEAADGLIKTDLRIRGLRGGVIAVDGEGGYVMSFNTAGMVRGVTTQQLEPFVRVFR
jgi:beta-aspartyl-peptidase (threonine type)